MSIRVQGRHIGFRVDRRGVLDRDVVPLLPPGWQPTERAVVERVYSLRMAGYEEAGRPVGPRKTHNLFVNAARVARSRDLRELLDDLDGDLRLYVAATARRRIFLHAGVVGWKKKAIVIPGVSHTGKSTLVAELLRLGATYYSDEYAPLDERGRVHPFPTPLSIRTRKGERPTRTPAEEMEAAVGSHSIPVALVVVTQFKKGVRWRPHRVAPGRGVLALLANTVPARHRPKASLETLRKVALGAQIISGSRGEARRMATDLIERVEWI